jgi:hypothetical protein
MMHIFAFLMFLTAFTLAFAVIMLTVLRHGGKMVAALRGRSLMGVERVAVEDGAQIVRLTPRRKPRAFTSPQWEPLPLAA